MAVRVVIQHERDPSIAKVADAIEELRREARPINLWSACDPYEPFIMLTMMPLRPIGSSKSDGICPESAAERRTAARGAAECDAVARGANAVAATIVVVTSIAMSMSGVGDRAAGARAAISRSRCASFRPCFSEPLRQPLR